MTDFLRKPTFKEALGKGRAPVDLKLPTRGVAAAYAQTRYKDVFAPMLTSMEMQRHGVENGKLIEQTLVDFAQKTGLCLFDAGLEIFRLHLRRVGIGTATTGDEKNGYWNDFEEMS